MWIVPLLTLLNFIVITNGRETRLDVCANFIVNAGIPQLLHEEKVAEYFLDPSSYTGIKILPNSFETSDALLSHDEQVVFTVFDNSYHIGATCTTLGRSLNCTDRFLAWPDKSLATKKSQFEGMAYNPISDTYFVVQEAIKTDIKEVFRGNIFEIRIDTKSSTPIEVLEACMVNWNFNSNNKGFEGLEFVQHSASGRSYLLGLCEANDCDLDSTLDNHGRILVLEKHEATLKKKCSWEPVGALELPLSVHFIDYSAVSIYHKGQKGLSAQIAVTSQQNSQIWLGSIKEIQAAPFFSLTSSSSSSSDGIVYDLARVNVGEQCEMQYCNVEGVAWQDEAHLVLVSDRVKSDQGAACISKDQSIHYFLFSDRLSK